MAMTDGAAMCSKCGRRQRAPERQRCDVCLANAREYQRLRWANDAEFRARKSERDRERRARDRAERALDAEFEERQRKQWREYQRVYWRRRMATDSEFRERERQRWREQSRQRRRKGNDND